MPNARKISATAPESLQLVLPATSANLGPAFDAAAIALNLYLKVTARLHPEFTISASGRDGNICGNPQDHLLLMTYRELLEKANRPVRPIALRLQNEIPIGKGCGSSAAVRLAGIALAVHFAKLGWNDNQIVAEASRLEHHPDNAAACWFGGLAIARVAANGTLRAASFRPKGDWPLLLVVPAESLPTERARQVLPEQYARADAVLNIQNSMLLLSALLQGKPDLLADALHDRMHQPFRAALCPLLPAMEKLAGSRGVLGMALSGAGPAVLLFVEPGSDLSRVQKGVEKYLREQGLPAECIPARISMRGGCAGGGWARSKE